MVGAKKRVRLHTKDGRTFEGLLLHRRPMYVLIVASLIEAPHPDDQGGEIREITLDGEVRIERDNVSFFQVVR